MKNLSGAIFCLSVIGFGIAASQRPDPRETLRLFNQKCIKQGVYNIEETLKTELTKFQKCGNDVLDKDTQVRQELYGAKDKCYWIYCRRWPEVYNCAGKLVSTARSCLTQEEQKNFNKGLEVMEKVMEYFCFEDGSQFAASEGPECIRQHQAGMQNCTISLKDLSNSFTVTLEEQCQNLDILAPCIYQELRKCNSPYTANMFNDIVKIVQKEISCEKGANQVAAKSTTTTSKEASSSSGIADKVVERIINTNQLK